MSIWVEVHCDTPIDDAAPMCPVYIGGYPGALGRSMIPAHDAAVAAAHKAGWTKREGSWYCRACSERNRA